MSLEAIYVTRHGFRSSWHVDPVTGNYSASIRSPTGLPTDPVLTSHGVEQSKELADHLLQLTPTIDQIYSSPYYRCLQTVQPFVLKRRATQSLAQPPPDGSGGSLLSVRVENALSEWYGLAHFEHPTSAPLSELQVHFPHVDANYISSPGPPRNGESITRLHERVARAVEDIIERSDREGKRSVLICTHAAVVIALGRVLTGRMPEDAGEEDFGAHTCGLSMYKRQTEKNNVVATAIATPPRDRSAGAEQSGDIACNARRDLDLDHRSGGLGLLKSTVPSLGGWICETNSDCSFLRSGEERGWRFSGDESFIDPFSRPGASADEDQDTRAAVAGTVPRNGQSSSKPGTSSPKL
ncbi:phosphoglycerate mutase-like protein [Xylariomycetidae sp. FL2044]|nr:phosphoglycerate mutase-like protein [Xylariomycetidae sp. FL2044]